MNEREAQGWIEDIPHDGLTNMEITAIEVASMALEKQIPKKPIGDDTVKICSCSRIVFLEGHIKRFNFCPKCGQKLDWEER